MITTLSKKQLFFLPLMMLAFCGNIVAQQFAAVQAIHNSADPAASKVDVWLSTPLGSSKLLPDFGFREATSFTPAPAGIPIIISFAPAGSASVADTFPGLSVRATLAANERYVLIAQGNVGSGFSANPNGLNTGFAALAVTPIRDQSSDPSNVDFLVVHGSTDAPAVDVFARGIPTPIVPNLAYNQSSNYLSVPAGKYILDINVAGTNLTAFTKVANLTGLEGNALVVFASGYLSPENNNDGQGFGLFAALANGTVVELSNPSAQIQVIHNSADPVAASVDIYYNGALLLPGFGFREATPYVTVDAEKDIHIGIAGSESSSADDTLANFTFNLPDGETFVIMASGVLGIGPNTFAPNPNGKDIGFGLQVYQGARTVGSSNDKVDLLVFHGATDAPAVDVATAGTVLVPNLEYTDFQGYLSVDPAEYVLDINVAGTETTVVSYVGNLTSLAGQAVTVFASGFLSPENNGDGKNDPDGFAVLAALANGTVVELPLFTSSVRTQQMIKGTLYPNPATDVLRFTSNHIHQASYQILDLTGRVMASGTWSDTHQTVDVSGLSCGLYTFKLVSENKAFAAKLQVIK
jgi:hypothetical protein